MKTLLFFDDWLLHRRDGLERVWHPPILVKEIFSDSYPGFLGYGGYMTAFYDERARRYVLYLAVYPPKADPETFVVRLESDDPYTWPNPRYDRTVAPAWKGFANVLVDSAGERFWPYAVQSLAGTPLAERGWVTTSYYYQKHWSVLGFSADGLHFNVDREHPWRDPGADQSGNILWSAHAGTYVLFTRRVQGERRIAIATTTDFQRYTTLLTALQPDVQDPLGTEFYDMPVRPYEDMYVGLLHTFASDPSERRHVKGAGRVETQLAHSYNGIHWCRSHREPFLGVRDYGLPGGGGMYGMDMLQTRGPKPRLLFFTVGAMGEHGSYAAIQAAGLDVTGFFTPLLYELRLDGFCSLRTRARDGVLETKTLVPRGAELTLNLRTTAHTTVRVQMLHGHTLQPIPGYTLEEAVPIRGDHLFAVPRWRERNDIAELVGKPVRIEIHMREAEIFAIRMPCAAQYVWVDPIDTLASAHPREESGDPA